jgi:CDP-paratose 2-epimerase
MNKRKIAVTGGAGFIGTNTVAAFSRAGDDVVVFDNLERRGAEANLAWLREHHDIAFHRGDMREAAEVEQLFQAHPDIAAVIHLAAQTAVTTSVVNPREDFETNALGTFNLLEAIRALQQPPALLYASTNKVYGGLDEVGICEVDTRHRFRDLPHGVPETWTLDFHSPYGCSKGTADQYVRDYARIYGLPTVVFRQSCIYGQHQFGIEDQGWVAWFALAVLHGQPISVFGDGKQVRDILFVDDLVDAYMKALYRIEHTAGKVYNIGGGPKHSISVWKEFQPLLAEICERPVEASFCPWRPGDQKVFIADIRRAEADFGWAPRIGVEEGISRLCSWIRGQGDAFRKLGLID